LVEGRKVMLIDASAAMSEAFWIAASGRVTPYDLSPVVGPSLLSSTEANSTADVDFTNVTSNAVWFSLNVTLPDAAIQNVRPA
jgi:hypothetical protein